MLTHASLNVSERREWEERAERGPAPGGGKQRHGKSEVERRVIFIDRGSGGGTLSYGFSFKGAVGAEPTYSGTSWTALALEVGKSPTATRWRAELPVV